MGGGVSGGCSMGEGVDVASVVLAVVEETGPEEAEVGVQELSEAVAEDGGFGDGCQVAELREQMGEVAASHLVDELHAVWVGACEQAYEACLDQQFHLLPAGQRLKPILLLLFYKIIFLLLLMTTLKPISLIFRMILLSLLRLLFNITRLPIVITRLSIVITLLSIVITRLPIVITLLLQLHDRNELVDRWSHCHENVQFLVPNLHILQALHSADCRRCLPCSDLDSPFPLQHCLISSHIIYGHTSILHISDMHIPIFFPLIFLNSFYREGYL